MEETKGDEPEVEETSVEEAPDSTPAPISSDEPASAILEAEDAAVTPEVAVAYPVPLATEASAEPAGGIFQGLSAALFGMPKKILRRASNRQTEGLPDTEETPE